MSYRRTEVRPDPLTPHPPLEMRQARSCSLARSGSLVKEDGQDLQAGCKRL